MDAPRKWGRIFGWSILWAVLLSPSVVGAEATVPELTLKQCINLALANNALVQAAQLQKDAAEARVTEAKASLLPRFSAAANYLKMNEGTPIPVGVVYDPTTNQFFLQTMEGPAENVELRLSANQPLYTGGALRAGVAAANWAARAAEADLETRRQEVALQVATAYYGLLTAARLVRVNEEALANAEAHLEVVKVLFEAGTVLKTDLLRTEVAVGQARQDLIRARHALEMARLNLVTLVGLPVEAKPQLAEVSPAKVGPLPDLADCLKIAYANRPELMAVKAQLEAARAALAQTKAGYLPAVSLAAVQSRRGSEPSDLEHSWTVTLNASLNLFDWGVTRARVRQAEDNVRMLELRLKSLEDRIYLEVNQAYQAVREAEERLPLAETMLKQAVENLALTQVRYEAGLATTLDVLDGQVLVTKTETAQVQAVYDYQLARARLAKAMGQVDALE
ncbi:MAG: TolC family protein [Firmicutes bacterium]|nr:TolC family protein [Bacillota bacterium]